MPKCLNLNAYNLGAATWNVVVKRDGPQPLYWNDDPVAWLTGYPVPRKGDVIDLDHPEIEGPLVVVDVIWHIRDESAPEIEVRAEKMREQEAQDQDPEDAHPARLDPFRLP